MRCGSRATSAAATGASCARCRTTGVLEILAAHGRLER
jgi:hypothetical protein